MGILLLCTDVHVRMRVQQKVCTYNLCDCLRLTARKDCPQIIHE